MPQQQDSRIPVTLITGFLGAGKSTLLNTLMKDPAFSDAAVLVNEFGDIGLDTSLIRAVDDKIITLTTGCVCCSVQGELVTALRDLYFKRVRGQITEFSRLIIETSGLAIPYPILATLQNEPLTASAYRIDGIITVVDAEHAMAHLDDNTESREQIAIADRLLISKADRVDAATLSQLHSRIAHINPLAHITTMSHGDVSPELVINCFSPSHHSHVHTHDSDDHDHDHHHKHDDGITGITYQIAEGWDPKGLESRIRLFLSLNHGQILRLKGIVKCSDHTLWAVHGVRHIAYPLIQIDRCQKDLMNKVVVISKSKVENTSLLNDGPIAL